MIIGDSKSRPGSSGMTLLEMLVSISILVVIIFGLTAAFNQTQRIFVTGLGQTDILEGGRSALDLIRRDLEPTTLLQTNALSGGVEVGAISIEAGAKSPVVLEGIAGTTTNFLEKFFLMRQTLTNTYLGVGYRVLNLFANYGTGQPLDLPPAYVGTLYRFSSANVQQPLVAPPIGALAPINLARFVFTPGNRPVAPDYLVAQGYLTEVLEGVVHFQVNFYDQQGNLMTNPPVPPANLGLPATPQNILEWGAFDIMNGSSTPAFVEIELGVLEPAMVEQFKARFAPLLVPTGGGPPHLPAGPGIGAANFGGLSSQASSDPYAAFLANHLDNIHYFRTQIPIRTGLTVPLP